MVQAHKGPPLVERLWHKLLCALDRHHLCIIATCGHACQHLACHWCFKEFGVNHDARCLLPWHDVRDFHIAHGYDEKAAVDIWYAKHKWRL